MRLSTAMLFDLKISMLSRTGGTIKDGPHYRVVLMLLLDRSLKRFLTTFHEISHFIILLMHIAKCQLRFHIS